MTLFESDYAPRERKRMPRRQRFGVIALSVTALCAVIFAVAPSPYVIEKPGPVYDTLGTVTIDDTDVPLITISGTPSYDTVGTLDMLTVSISGDPSNPPSWLEAGLAWFQPDQALLPMNIIFPPGQSAEDQQKENKTLMVNSQQDAIAAALINLGYPVDQHVTVQDLAAGTPAKGILESGDIVRDANGVRIESVAELKTQVDALAGAAVPLTVDRDGTILHLSITPEKVSNGNYMLGIVAGVTYSFPFSVKIQLDNVGGPSAGMMFALGIISKLTPNGDFTGGKSWAGTGTIRADGTVGPIGGIRQKMAGARNGGANYMLAPKDDCDEVVGHIPAGLEVFSVATLDDAKNIVQTVASGAETSQLPRCEAG